MPVHRPRRKKRVRTQTNSVMVFLLAFVGFLIVFGGICLWAVIQINQRQREESQQSTSSLSEAESFEPEDARTLLIVTTNGGEPQGFVAVRTDPSKAQVRVLAIPRDTVVDYKTSEIRLGELFSQQGAVAARNALQGLTGIQPDNYVVISYPSIERLIEGLEAGVIMTLNEDLNYSGEGLTIHIDGGRRTLSASQAVDVLRYPSWYGGRKQRADIQAEMTAALMNQYLRASRISQADNDFSFMINLTAHTDMLISHFKDAKAGLAHLAQRNEGDICTVLSLDGAYQGSGDAIRYYAADDITDTLSLSFG